MEKSGRSRGRSHVPEWGLGRSVLSTINDMERVFEESLHRPFSGMPALPFRHLLQAWDSTGDFTPSVDIMEAEGEVVVKAELPGMKREDIKVKLLDSSLIISGEKRAEEKVEKGDYLRMERSYGSFHRTLHLPEGIDQSHISASFKDGILEIRMPKTGGDKTHNIRIE